MAGKRKTLASESQRPSKRPHLVEDDADQNISDDGQVPTYNSDHEEDDSGDGSESDAIVEDNDNATQPSAHVEPLRPPETHSVWKAPTTEELHQLKEATELFRSGAFKLKIDALVPQIKPKQTSAQLLEPLLHALHQHIGSIPPLSPQHPLQAARKLRKINGVQVLYTTPQPRDDTNWKVAFEKPSNIQIVGSWAHQMSIIGRDGVGFSVDLNVEMPSSLFQEKDYLDSRFFHKRSYYLAVIASSLVSSELDLEVQYDLPEQNPRRSSLVVRPKKGGKYDLKKLNASVRIILALPLDSPIAVSRLSPSHANIRVPNPSTLPPQPTPFYNNDILRCMTPTAHLFLMYSASKEITHFKEATALLRVWANQRGYAKGNKTVFGFEALGSWWGFVLAYLVWGDDERSLKNVGTKKRKGRKPIGKGLSSYQMFRAAMDFFASHDFVQDAVRVRTISGPKPPHFDFAGTSIPVFVSPSTVFNFLSSVPMSSLELLRQDARLTLKALDGPSSTDTFELMFMRDLRDMQLRFDTIIRLDISRAVLPEPVVDHASRNAAIASRLDKILKQALGSRATIVALVQTPSKPFSSTESQPPEPTVIEVGIILDPDNAPRLVDHGPPAEDPEACQRFRDFWGEKSELRRFNDGRIVESVVWELVGKSTGERLQIPGRIVRYIVGRHLQIPSEDVTVFNTQYDGVLSIPPDIASRYSTVAPGTAPEAVQRLVVSAYDELVKDIKAMESIPLGLVTSSPVSEALRYTAVFPTLPIDVDAYPLLPDHAKYLPATEIVLQFERSSQWPDDLTAIHKVKMALLEAIAQLLNAGGSKAHVALDRNSDAIEDHVSLEVILPSGFAFRARIYHDREQTLLERLIADRNTPEYKRKHFQKVLHHHLKRFVHTPRHHAALHALHHRYPSYSHTARLVKRWLNAHWLAPHISPETMELLCAHVYLDTGVREPPSTGVSGFSRVVALLAEWNWRESPLVVPVYTSASMVDRTHRVVFPPDISNQAQERFTKHRAVDPRFSRGAWTIVTEEDLSGHIWSDSVDSIIAGRTKDLAKATLDYLRKGMDDGELDIKTMLLHPTNDYDFLIHLDPSVAPRYIENLHADPSLWESAIKYANIRIDTASVYGTDPRVQFDPVGLLFEDIRRIYGDNLVLFYDPMGGVTMGGVWNPLLRNPRPFRVLLGFSSMPIDSGGKDNKKPNVVLNESAVLAEIQRLGKGLIKSVVVQGL